MADNRNNRMISIWNNLGIYAFDLQGVRQQMSDPRDVLFDSFYKTYASFLDELSADDVFEGLLGWGLFGNKVPPIFTSKPFYDYRISRSDFPDKRKKYGWVTYRYMKHTTHFREFGIPEPFAYEALVRHIVNHWEKIKNILKENTYGQPYCVSRIHIRKMHETKAIFDMNYKRWRTDANPLPTILIGSHYMAYCDISRCFPSMYTHAVDWAIEGRETAKRNKISRISTWGSEMDDRAAALKNGETHGLLVGPHASNLLSELILTKIDQRLFAKGYRYIRNIDDYQCFTDSFEQAELFIVDLEKALSEYRLSLNQAKTRIEKLPRSVISEWPRILKNYSFSEPETKYSDVQSFLDLAVALTEREGDASVLNYALRILSSRQLKASAKKYLADMASHLICVFPYLAPYAEELVIIPTGMSLPRIKTLSQILYSSSMKTRDYLTACYALYYASKYGFDLSGISFDEIAEADDCLLQLFAFVYAKSRRKSSLRNMLRAHAKEMDGEDFDRNWLFAYHALPIESLPDGKWREIKNRGIKFIDKKRLSSNFHS